ncbi:MAG TPA: aminotransferase class III-fold pyridoxal phosphate-dependent enzyme [Gemmatimonadales bacterium]|nr:aminotransferase class III-fold pyridoxal phosphate-dependent enzyme [Gemmatimonadales bacterium]
MLKTAPAVTDKVPSHNLLPVYQHMPVRPVRGRGSWLIDADGHEWLDAYGGHAVAATGHSHPHVVQAIARQAETLLFYSAAVPLEIREQLASELVLRCQVAGGRVFFCNSGAEANENALHLARRATGRSGVVAVTGGWHGRTVATIACTDGAKYEEWARGAGMPIARRVPFDDVATLERTVDETTAAVIVEPVQGLAGARDCSIEFLKAARAVCDRHGAALIFDEIQCGVGRSGAFTAAQVYGVVPDALTLAKGLASGLPIGAVVAAPKLTAAVKTGDLGSTFGGGPVVCAAALATLEVIDREELIANARAQGERLRQGAIALGVPKVTGRGLLLGLQLGRPAAAVQQALFTHHILTGTASDPNVLRLMPPLTFTTRESDLVLGGLKEVLA